MADEHEQANPDDQVLFSGTLPIKYYGTEDVIGIFADQVVVSNLGNMFTLYFYQMQLPTIVGDPSSTEVRAKAREELKDVPAKCVARVVLTPTLMEQFYGAMGNNLERYKRVVQGQAQKAEE